MSDSYSSIASVCALTWQQGLWEHRTPELRVNNTVESAETLFAVVIQTDGVLELEYANF